MKTHKIIFTILTILILWNLLLPGYIFSLDLIPRTHYGMEHFISSAKDSSASSLPFHLTLSAINTMIPAEIIQKTIFFLVLFLSFTTMYRLMPTKSVMPKYFAAILYTINPFVYTRFLAGHINFLLAYSITPLAVYFILKFAEDPNKKNTILTALTITIAGILNMHHFVLIPIILAAIIIAKPKKAHIKPLLTIILLLLLLNAYWLIQSTKTSTIDAITQDDIEVFQSTPILNYNTAFTLAGMHGFWRSGYEYSKDSIPAWPILFIIIFFISVHGYISTKNKHRHAFALLWLISIALSIGVTADYFREIYLFLYNNIFFFKGFREPQKFIALAVLAYAYLGGLGINTILKEKTKVKNIIVVIAFAAVFLYSYMMFFAFSGQLTSQQYPDDYYEIRYLLENDTSKDFNTLILPWHNYMDFSWNENRHKRLANPATHFFANTISADNMEAENIYSQSQNPHSAYIESTLKNTTDLASKLVRVNVRYIILQKEVDYKDYLYLKDQPNLILIKETPNLILFKNANPTYKIYQTDNPEDTKNMTPLTYKKLSPFRYEIAEPKKKYLVFTDRYDPSWKLKGSRHLEDTHINVYGYENGRYIIHTSCYQFLLGFIISLFTLIYMGLSIKIKNKE